MDNSAPNEQTMPSIMGIPIHNLTLNMMEILWDNQVILGDLIQA